MARKVFISFLGTGYYQPCKYAKGDFCSPELCFIQEATLQYLSTQQPWSENDVAYILLTKGALKTNWVNDGHIDRDTHETSEGLKQRLNNACLPMPIEPVTDLPDGNSEQKIWDIFTRVYDLLQDGDELHFDLTHGYRYLPMLILVLGNYAKFLKKVTIKHISYGNYEGRNRETNEAPIVDLLPLSALQDWTNATSNYTTCGNAEGIARLTTDAILPILKATKGQDESAKKLRTMSSRLNSVVDSLNVCRGMNIVSGEQASQLVTAIDDIDNVAIKPLSPIMNVIKQSILPFAQLNTTANTIKAAKWCHDHNLLQQAITILQEGVVTILCQRNGIEINDESKRECINQAFKISYKNWQDEESKWKVNDNNIVLVRRLLRDPWLLDQEFVNLFSNMTEVRNDFNHSGMRNVRPPMPPDKLKKNIKKCIDSMAATTIETVPEHTMLVNLTNHPCSGWSSEQTKAAIEAYGQVVDFPFPMVNPDLDEAAVATLADNVVSTIIDKYGTGVTIHLMGEFTLANALLRRFAALGITCIASTTERIVREIEPGHKEVRFEFRRFRRYEF